MIKNLRPALLALFAVSAFACHISAFAVTQTFGAGSAVTSIDASASFESVAALNDNPYLEGGMSFSRFGLTFDNNGCGFGGCAGRFPGFDGNYMYGTGSGYFEIAAPVGKDFTGLEFITGTGYSLSTPVEDIVWSAYNNGSLVSQGFAILNAGNVIGFKDASGFDVIRYTSSRGIPLEDNAPAFDTVHAQFSTSPIPEPEVYAMLAAGLGMMGFLRRRERKPSQSSHTTSPGSWSI
jgi:PEP-CTERM motif